MNSCDVPPPRIRTAIALSIAAHLCALLLLAVIRGDNENLQMGPLNDTITVQLTTMVRRAAPVPRHAGIAASAAAASRPDALTRATPRPARALPRHSRDTRTASFRRPPVLVEPGRPPHASSMIAKPAVVVIAAVPTPAPTAPAPVLTPVPSPSPSPSPSPTPRPSLSPSPATTTTPVTVVAANFSGLFSQNYPPALAAPGELTAMRSRLSVSVHIRVDVDETGRATGVRFVGPVADETLAQKIRSELLALHYVPADCNGLHCDGTLDINY